MAASGAVSAGDSAGTEEPLNSSFPNFWEQENWDDIDDDVGEQWHKDPTSE